MMSGVELDLSLLRSLALGVALAAACGLRVFVPLLMVSGAAALGWVHPSGGLAWLGSTPALIVFAAATAAEVAAYHVPWLDNALDWLGAPVALAAGTMLTASMLPADDPMLRWLVALIAGGGAAASVHVGTAVVRKASSLTTGGLANPFFAFLEAAGALAVSVIALLAPALALAMIVGVAIATVRLVRRRRRARAERAAVSR